MTTIIKKPRKIKLFRISLTLFLIMCAIFVASSTLLRSYNVSLIASKEKIDKEIKILTKDNETLLNEVKTLGAYDRIAAIAKEEGLSANQQNIIAITSDSEDEQN